MPAEAMIKKTDKRTLTLRKVEEGSEHPYMLQIQAGMFGAEIYLSHDDMAHLTEMMLETQETPAPVTLSFMVTYDK